MFVIKSDDGYWNNEIGWVYDKESATVFKHDNYELPIGSNVKWQQL